MILLEAWGAMIGFGIIIFIGSVLLGIVKWIIDLFRGRTGAPDPDRWTPRR